MTDSANPLQDGLFFEARMPLIWHVIEQLPSDAELAQQNADNEDLLRTFSMVEQATSEYTDDQPEVFQELARLDGKLNLMLELLGEVLARQTALPAAVNVRLGAHGAEWREEHPPAVDSWLAIRLYPHPQLPRPLALNGVVTHARTDTVQVAFHGVSEAARDWLDKLIFRRHRRAVAQSRAHREPGIDA